MQYSANRALSEPGFKLLNSGTLLNTAAVSRNADSLVLDPCERRIRSVTESARALQSCTHWR